MAENTASSAARTTDDLAQRAADHPWFERAARLGFIANGVVHILIGGIAVGIAFGEGGSADASGAIGQMSEQPFGTAQLWFCFLGCALLALWNLVDAFFGSNTLRSRASDTNGADPRDEQGRERWKDFVKTLGQAVAYGAVASTFFQFLFAGGSDSSESSSTASSKVAELPGGIVILTIVGVGVAAVGVVFIVNAFRHRWTEDFRMPSRPVVRSALNATGVAGYLAKGAAIIALGGVIIYSAITHDPEEAGGVDAALKAIREQPFGPYLLCAVGAGLVVYGAFLFLRARYDRMD